MLNLPNTLTASRIFLIPVFAALLLYGRNSLALLVYATAAVTDLLDGFIARLGNQQTTLGRILDPVADKFLLATSFIVFSYLQWVPLWLTITVLSRDIIVVTGTLLVRLVSGELVVHPTRTGKAAVAGQMLLIGYIMAAHAWAGGGWPGIGEASFVVAGLSVASGIQYIREGLRIGAGI